MPAAIDVDQVVENVLADFTRVELPAGALDAALARRTHVPERDRFLWLPAPVWAAIALALLILLGLSFYRADWLDRRQPRLANEHTTLSAVSPDTPLTPEQKELIHILLTDPAALGTLQPGQLDKAKPTAKPPKKP